MNSTLYSKAIRTPIIGDYLESACIPRDDQSVLAAARYLNDTRYDSGRFEMKTMKCLDVIDAAKKVLEGSRA